MWSTALKLTLLLAILKLSAPADAQDTQESLRLWQAQGWLPEGRFGHAALYDGADSVYILGGRSLRYHDEILKYSLEADSVSVAAHFRFGIADGSAIVATDGDIFYFGGYANEGNEVKYEVSNITRFSPSTGAVTTVAHLPLAYDNSAAVWDPERQVAYIFGGFTKEDGIVPSMNRTFEYNPETNRVQQVARLPERRHSAGAAWDTIKKVGYVFGGVPSAPGTRQDVIRYDPGSANFTKMPATLPLDYLAQKPCVVHAADDRFYVIHGPKLIRFTPLTNLVEEIEVAGWPYYLEEVACTYVPKMDRIYIFSGYDGTSWYPVPKIWYLDLNNQL